MTDANLVLGLLGDDAPLAGGVRLDRDAAECAVRELADELGMDSVQTAEGIRRVAATEMAAALRVVTVQRGVDPREHALLAFGGAGPLHAAQIADELGLATILCPRTSGVLAALGLVVSERRRDVQRSLLLSGEELTQEAVAHAAGELAEHARAALGEVDARLSATYELRYRGQSFELAVRAGMRPSLSELRTGFERAHEERYGYSDPEQELELVTLRIAATAPGAEIELAAPGTTASLERSRRRAFIDAAEVELEVLRGIPAAGERLDDPCIVELPESTVLLAPGWSGQVDHTGSIRMERR